MAKFHRSCCIMVSSIEADARSHNPTLPHCGREPPPHTDVSKKTTRGFWGAHYQWQTGKRQKAILLLSWRVHDLCLKTQYEEQRSEISSKSGEQWSEPLGQGNMTEQNRTAAEPNQTRRFKCQGNSSHDLSRRVTLHDIFMLFSAIHLDMEMQAC